MKVIDFLEKANSTLFSYEIIPPFRGGSIDKVFDLVDQLMPFDPPFIDLTSRSAESYYSNKNDLTSKRIRRKRPGTIGISAAIKNKYNVETVPHILCNGFSKEETEDALIELNYLGIDNVLAVRGDDLRKDDHNLNSKPGNKYASDLVHQIKNMNNGNYLEDLVESTPSDFCIGVGAQPEMSLFNSSSNCIVKNSAFRYIDGSALEMYSNNNTIENCYFYHIDYTATDLNGLMTTIQMGGSNNIFRKNTLHKMGASATLNPGNSAIIELNDMSDSGHMQSDGALVQCMVGQQPDVQIRYNWLHNTEKFGARFDGEGDGFGGHIHHNVIWNVEGGIMVKGHDHNIYNNTTFDNGAKNDIIIMIDQGGNEGTLTVNNAANKIAGHRTSNYDLYPVPGYYENNWNGYQTNLDVKDLLVDVENFDFSPIEGSTLVDNGSIYDNLDITFNGNNPDIGAYEFGGEYWVPGITWNINQEFGDNFNPPENLFIEIGDVNYDNFVNVVDIVNLVNWIFSNIYVTIADINNDDILNVNDIVLIVNIIFDN